MSLEHMGTLRKTRRRGLWPPPIQAAPRFADSRVLVARNDRFGDMMLTLPFLSRVLASGARVSVLTPDKTASALVSAVGVPCIAKPAEAAAFAPDIALIPITCRTLRSRRHRERWEFVLELLATLRGTPVVVPAIRRAEALSLFTGPCVTPVSGYTALTVMDRFANGLGLPRAAAPLLERWTRAPAERMEGAVVLNLSSGRPGEAGRRDLPIAFWSRVAAALAPGLPVASIVQPGDDARRAEAESDPVLSKGVVCFEDIRVVADWLGRQRLLISPETGLCHLARNLGLPMVVLTPLRNVLYFYPRAPDVTLVSSMRLDELDDAPVAAAARRLLGEA